MILVKIVKRKAKSLATDAVRLVMKCVHNAADKVKSSAHNVTAQPLYRLQTVANNAIAVIAKGANLVVTVTRQEKHSAVSVKPNARHAAAFVTAMPGIHMYRPCNLMP